MRDWISAAITALIGFGLIFIFLSVAYHNPWFGAALIVTAFFLAIAGAIYDRYQVRKRKNRRYKGIKIHGED